jgi:hypothetical protein
MKDWNIVPAYSNYTTLTVVTNRMWRGKDEKRAFFALGSNNVVTLPAIVLNTNKTVAVKSPPIPE